MAKKKSRSNKAQKRRARSKAKKSQSRVRRASAQVGPKGAFARAAAGPISVCKMSRGWDAPGALVVVAIARAWRGEQFGATFLVDRGCLGIKNCLLYPSLGSSGVDRWLASLERFDLVDAEPGLVAALVDQAARFAADLGFRPAKDAPIARRLLAGIEATAAQREQTRAGGEDGRPAYVEGPHDATPEILRRLQRAVGPDGFTFVAAFDEEDALETWIERPLGHPIDVADITLEPGGELQSLSDRLLRLGVLKRALVLFAASTDLCVEREEFTFRDSVRRLLDRGERDELLDRFVHSVDAEGTAIIDSFIVQFEHRLSAWDITQVEAWHDWVTTAVEILGRDGPGLRARDLATNLEVTVYSNLGSAWLDDAPDEGLLIGRFVPYGWDLLVSGPLSQLPADAKPIVLYELARTCHGDPRAIYRDPVLLDASREQQRAQGRAFEAELGGRVVPVVGAHVGAYLDRINQRLQAVSGETEEVRRSRVDPISPPDHIVQAERVWLLHDDRYGLAIDPYFDHIERLFADPTLLDTEHDLAEWLIDLMLDPTTDPQPLVMAARRNPDGASAVLAALLDDPTFDWSVEGERRVEQVHYPRGRGPLPRTVALPSHLADALRAGPPPRADRERADRPPIPEAQAPQHAQLELAFG